MKNERSNGAVTGAVFSIGALATETGASVETIRYYERRGVLPRPRRTSGGYRLYSPADAERLRFIRRARELGFSLKQAREISGLSSDPAKPCDGICNIAQAHLVEVETKFRQLSAIRRNLKKLADCSGGRVSRCRIVKALTEPARP